MRMLAKDSEALSKELHPVKGCPLSSGPGKGSSAGQKVNSTNWLHSPKITAMPNSCRELGTVQGLALVVNNLQGLIAQVITLSNLVVLCSPIPLNITSVQTTCSDPPKMQILNEIQRQKMQVLQHLFSLGQHVNAISFPKPYCMGRNAHESSRHRCKQEVSLFFLVSELGDKKFHGWSTVKGEIFSFPFLFPPPQTSSKEYIAFSWQHVPITFNCTFQQMY